ncbi:hypothetical protein [Solibacillus sp. CAU 1738]|uniref:hypothetical protein n=1 Tax=Solibacillus sp. CAU 1738 TaxID=3140363 RepID=UPI0032602B86
MIYFFVIIFIITSNIFSKLRVEYFIISQCKLIGVEGATLQQEQHGRKIHFCGDPPQKLVEAVPVERERLERKSTVSYYLF